MFVDNKYRGWYTTIITRAQGRVKPDIVEQHHIVPKSLGGSNAHSNLVFLTPREHFICHQLLFRFTIGKAHQKMATAMVLMGGRHFPSRLYEAARKIHAAHISSVKKGSKHTEKTKRHLSEIRKGKSATWNIGRKIPEEQKVEMTKARQGLVWWNDGKVSKTAKIAPGLEWKRGRLKLK